MRIATIVVMLELALVATSCSSSATNPSLGVEHDAGPDVDGAAGAAGGGCSGTTPCDCADTTIPGERTCDGLCRQSSDHVCCGDPSPSAYVACCASGCGVDVAMLDGFPSYFSNHPNCVGATCTSWHGACSDQCPPPTSEDQ